MKRNLICVLLSAFALSAPLTVTSCKDDGPSATETNLDRLTAHHWYLIKVTVDGVDQTSLFSGLALQWNNTSTFSSVNGGVVWPSTGTWSFTDDTGKALLLSLGNGNSAEATIETLTDTQLIISFHWDETTFAQGRMKSVQGDHFFEFESAD